MAGLPLWAAPSVKQFSDGEIHLQIQENVRGADCFRGPAHLHAGGRNLMELLLMMDALKRASAERITAVLPYYGYARQDRKDRPRMPISARLVASLIERRGGSGPGAGFTRRADSRFFRCSGGPSVCRPVMIEYFDSMGSAIDGGFAGRGRRGRARAFAKRLNSPLAIIDKRRTK